MIKLLSTAAAAVLAAGCGSVQMTKTPDPDVDHAYVAKVEQSARLGGAQVTWVQRPTKRAGTTTGN